MAADNALSLFDRVARRMARHSPLVVALALFGTTVSQNMIRDGSFEGGGPPVSGGTGWAKVQISDCACEAPGALMVRPSEEGSFAELTFRASHPAGVFVFEALGKVSLDYVGSAEIYSLTAFNGATEVAHAVQHHIFFNATQRFAAWHLYSLQLVCPAAVTSVLLRIGSGEPLGQASGSFNSTDLKLSYAGGDALPVLSRGLAVEGPMGQYSRGPSLVTDGVTLRPPLNNNHWKVVAFTDRLKQLELDLGEVRSVCGARLVQTEEYYATRWCVCCVNSRGVALRPNADRRHQASRYLSGCDCMLMVSAASLQEHIRCHRRVWPLVQDRRGSAA